MLNISNVFSNLFNVLLNYARPGPFIQTQIDVPQAESSERAQEPTDKDSKGISSHPLEISSYPLDLSQEELIETEDKFSSNQGKINHLTMDMANPIQSRANRLQSRSQSEEKQQQAYRKTQEHALETFQLVSPTSISPSNTRLDGQIGIASILGFTAAVLYFQYQKAVRHTEYPSTLYKYFSNQKAVNDFRDKEIKEKPTTETTETTETYHSGKLKGNKVSFSTKLYASPLVPLKIGERWVSMENCTVSTPEGTLIKIKKGQIGTVTKEEEGFLKAKITFDIKNQRYLTGLEEGHYLLPFMRL